MVVSADNYEVICMFEMLNLIYYLSSTLPLLESDMVDFKCEQKSPIHPKTSMYRLVDYNLNQANY